MTPPGFGANLARRVATALLALPTLLAVFFLGPPLLGAAVVALAAVLGLREFFGLLAARGIAPVRVAGFVVAAVFFVEAAYPRGQTPYAAPAAALVLCASALRRGGDVGAVVPAAAMTLLGALYLGGLGGSIAGLLTLEPTETGPWRMALLLSIIMGSDTVAFFAGHALGRHKLAPALSPGKTIEGAVGGLAGGVAGALAIRWLGLPDLPLRHALGLGVGVTALGTLGDLFESLLKRWAGVKDSGGLFPGHGGMLDRLDSLLFGAPVLYYYFLYARLSHP